MGLSLLTKIIPIILKTFEAANKAAPYAGIASQVIQGISKGESANIKFRDYQHLCEENARLHEENAKLSEINNQLVVKNCALQKTAVFLRVFNLALALLCIALVVTFYVR